MNVKSGILFIYFLKNFIIFLNSVPNVGLQLVTPRSRVIYMKSSYILLQTMQLSLPSLSENGRQARWTLSFSCASLLWVWLLRCLLLFELIQVGLIFLNVLV